MAQAVGATAATWHTRGRPEPTRRGPLPARRVRGVVIGARQTTQSLAVRVMRLVGRPDLIDEPWFVDQTGRLEHADELDEAIQAWISGHTTEEVLAAFEEQEGAIAPIYSIGEIVEDPTTSRARP